LPPVGQFYGGAIVAAADQHDLGSLPPVHRHHRSHPGAVRLDGVPVDIQHDLDAGVLGQILLHYRPAVVVAAGVAGVVVQSLIVEGVDSRRVEGVGDDPPHRTHIVGGVGVPGGVGGIVPETLRHPVALGGVGVHYQ